MLLVYWGAEDEDLRPLHPATTAPGFPTRADVAARYAERSGRDLSEIDFYVALGLWKLGIILEGVLARYTAGQYGEADKTGTAEFARTVEGLIEAASDAVGRLD
jgi:aminoglycoside phosphotransferase (APT) family kinase protein